MTSISLTEERSSPPPEDRSFIELTAMLNKASRVSSPSPEPTLFSVGGRGYYENPTSDLLAFFMRPSETHGLGNLFLSSFLECMSEIDLSSSDLAGVSVNREVDCKGGRIDLEVLGPDWRLLIENKILHTQNNPFELYENYANKLNGKPYFAILSPAETSARPERWKGVSYKKYLSTLRKKLRVALYKNPYNKWALFAREFILHIENLLYNPTMNTNQIKFIEENLVQITRMKEMDSRYEKYVVELLEHALSEKMNGYSFSVQHEEPWTEYAYIFRCMLPAIWGDQNDIVMMVSGRAHEGFLLRLFLKKARVTSLPKADKVFSNMIRETEDNFYRWTSSSGYTSTEDAINALCTLAQAMTKFLKD